MGRLRGVHVSSIVNEGIRAILNLFFFFCKRRFHKQKKCKTHASEQKQKRQHFFAHKKTSNMRKVACSLICVFMLFMCFLCFLCFIVRETKKDSIYLRIKTSKRKIIACLKFCAFFAFYFF